MAPVLDGLRAETHELLKRFKRKDLLAVQPAEIRVAAVDNHMKAAAFGAVPIAAVQSRDAQLDAYKHFCNSKRPVTPERAVYYLEKALALAIARKDGKLQTEIMFLIARWRAVPVQIPHPVRLEDAPVWASAVVDVLLRNGTLKKGGRDVAARDLGALFARFGRPIGEDEDAKPA